MVIFLVDMCCSSCGLRACAPTRFSSPRDGSLAGLFYDHGYLKPVASSLQRSMVAVSGSVAPDVRPIAVRLVRTASGSPSPSVLDLFHGLSNAEEDYLQSGALHLRSRRATLDAVRAACYASVTWPQFGRLLLLARRPGTERHAGFSGFWRHLLRGPTKRWLSTSCAPLFAPSTSVLPLLVSCDPAMHLSLCTLSSLTHVVSSGTPTRLIPFNLLVQRANAHSFSPCGAGSRRTSTVRPTPCEVTGRRHSRDSDDPRQGYGSFPRGPSIEPASPACRAQHVGLSIRRAVIKPYNTVDAMIDAEAAKLARRCVLHRVTMWQDHGGLVQLIVAVLSAYQLRSTSFILVERVLVGDSHMRSPQRHPAWDKTPWSVARRFCATNPDEHDGAGRSFPFRWRTVKTPSSTASFICIHSSTGFQTVLGWDVCVLRQCRSTPLGVE